MSDNTKDLWDDFWDEDPVAADFSEAAPLGTVPPEMEEFGKVLGTFFPKAAQSLFVGLVKRGETSLACVTLGSHLIGVSPGKTSKTWNGTWQQAIGSNSIPSIFWPHPSRGAHKPPPMAVMASRTCKSPADFGMWLNWVASKIQQTAQKQLLDALHPDNWLGSETRLAFQSAYDLDILGAKDMVCAEFPKDPVFTWYRGKTHPDAYGVPVLRKGAKVGHLILGRRDNCWRYGGKITTAEMHYRDPFGGTGLEFQHEAPDYSPDLVLPVMLAQAATEQLYRVKTFEWLINQATEQLRVAHFIRGM